MNLSLTAILLQTALLLLLSPLLSGVIKNRKAKLQNRRGPRIWQPYLDIAKFLRKDMVISEHASWVFTGAPYVVFITPLLAGLMVPMVLSQAPLSLFGGALAFVGLLALGRFFLALGGLDPASAFGGMGSSREAMIAALIEPSILVSIFAIGLFAGSTSVLDILRAAQLSGVPLAQPLFILVGLALFIVLIAETARIPVDDPATHLELTMVHEAMILEHSGRHLALMEYGAAVKQLVLMSLLANVCLPHDQWIAISGIGGLLLSVLVYIVKIIAVAILVAVAESATVKFRFFSVPNLAALAFILSFLGFLQFYILGR
jgi:formate hydrogenlyase subunit 4